MGQAEDEIKLAGSHLTKAVLPNASHTGKWKYVMKKFANECVGDGSKNRDAGDRILVVKR